MLHVVNVVVHPQFMLKFVGPTVLYGGVSDLRRKACTTPEREGENGPQLRCLNGQWVRAQAVVSAALVH